MIPKPTNKKPVGKIGKELEKKYSNTLAAKGVDLTEVDNILNEKEQSLKKKIWDLSKMEALVHSDPKLSGKYNEMAKDGEDKYGYHYNETIMNILFNDYVMNSQQYLQKYKNAIPKKKKRRDKSGIESLKQSIKGTDKVDKNESIKVHNNSLPGVIEELKDNNGFKRDGEGDFDDRSYLTHRINKKYDTMDETKDAAQQAAIEISKEEKNNKESNLKENNNPCLDGYEQIGMKKKDSKEVPNCVPEDEEKDIEETTTAASSGSYNAKLGAKNNVYESKEKEDEKMKDDRDDDVDETTSTSVVGGGSADGGNSYAYVGPFGKKTKDHVTNKPAWEGGKIIGENYLTDPSGFKKLFESLSTIDEEELDYAKVPDDSLQRILSDLMNLTNIEGIRGAKETIQKIQDVLRSRGKLKNENENIDGDEFAGVSSQLLTDLQKILNQATDIKAKEYLKKINDALRNRKMTNYPNEGMTSPNDFSRVPMAEHHLESKEEKANFIAQKANVKPGQNMTSQEIMELPDDTVDAMYKELEGELKESNMNEKAKSVSQQQAAGIALAAKRGEGDVDKLQGSAKQMYNSMSEKELEDFAETKHKGIPNKVDETNYSTGIPLNVANDLARRVYEAGSDNEEKILSQFIQTNSLSPESLKHHFQKIIDSGKVSGSDDQYYMFQNIITIANDLMDQVSDAKKQANKDQAMRDYQRTPHYKAQKKDAGIEESIIDDNPNSMIKSNATSIARTMEGKEVNEDGHCRKDEVPVPGKIPGEQGSCRKKDHLKTDPEDRKKNKANVEAREKREREQKIQRDKKEQEYQKELEKDVKKIREFKEFLKMNEDRRPSALVQMDRLHKENTKNFKKEIDKSNTDDIADEMSAKEQYTEVGENPYELAEKIEKEKLKQNKGESFENSGNSTNNNNKEIPKRNATDKESEDIMLNRGLGMQDVVYDNEPDERFEERMEKDMGEEIYDQRKRKMDYRAQAPMYNKDTEPVGTDSIKKDQFDKEVSGYKSRRGVDESKKHIVTGKYKDDFNRNKFIQFNINECNEINEVKGTKLSLDGLGNSFNQKVNENKSVTDIMKSFNFYIQDDGTIAKLNIAKVKLNESNNKTGGGFDINSMKKLWDYKPSKFVDTTTIKKNRGF